MTIEAEIGKLIERAAVPMKSESEMRMVEIIVLKYKAPEVETECAMRLIEYTEWPYKLNIYDNRLNTASTGRIWNKLIKDATCDFIMFLDSDAFVPACHPCWLTRMMESFRHPSCQVVVPLATTVGNAYQRSAVSAPYPSETLHDKIWSGVCWLARKSLFENIGYLDEAFYGYGQDNDFAHRLRTALKDSTYLRRDVLIEHKGNYSFKKAESAGEFSRDVDMQLAISLLKKKHGTQAL